MNKRRAQSQVLMGGLFLLLFLYLFNSPTIDQYIASVKGQPVVAPIQQAEWIEKLEELKSKHDLKPIDARIDPVWKAIPGYDGLKLDIEASIENLGKRGKWDDEAVVFEEVKPTVVLSDLKPSPIYRGNAEKPIISFMINVAWGNEHLPSILETLDRYKVKSTFFLDGSWVNKYPDEARKIKEAGHEIGSHAYSHPKMADISLNRIRLEITKTNEVLQKELGVKPTLFAPPSGSFDDRTVQMAAQEGMYTILWTLDTIDWRKPAPSVILDRINPQLANGSLILMHPTKESAIALPKMIEAAKAKKLKVGTVSELLSSKRIYTIE
ncbi:hypothetical protein BEP19_07705 [Ammoniphilus oxalaticus]|uniref:NodB homology domain-containing protein n=1 Tax=Ammoniphilus oxalaticus TaxID=66863 RepID=A0A419SK18_9BACL|nr:polysaccharide deacetylase family protein [Ammoniphilus oxalaticus]RKD24279.1 hypothetical protein BEP19_07705 [Ammoniphilus oxalaticus]